MSIVIYVLQSIINNKNLNLSLRNLIQWVMPEINGAVWWSQGNRDKKLRRKTNTNLDAVVVVPVLDSARNGRIWNLNGSGPRFSVVSFHLVIYQLFQYDCYSQFFE